MIKTLCAKCAQPAVPKSARGGSYQFDVQQGLPVCFPQCPSAEQLELLRDTLGASEIEQSAAARYAAEQNEIITARNLRYFLVGAL